MLERAGATLRPPSVTGAVKGGGAPGAAAGTRAGAAERDEADQQRPTARASHATHTAT